MKERLMAIFIAGLFLIIIGVSLLQSAGAAETLAQERKMVVNHRVPDLIGKIMLAIGVLLALGSLITQLRQKRRDGPHS